MKLGHAAIDDDDDGKHSNHTIGVVSVNQEPLAQSIPSYHHSFGGLLSRRALHVMVNMLLVYDDINDTRHVSRGLVQVPSETISVSIMKIARMLNAIMQACNERGQDSVRRPLCLYSSLH